MTNPTPAGKDELYAYDGLSRLTVAIAGGVSPETAARAHDAQASLATHYGDKQHLHGMLDSDMAGMTKLGDAEKAAMWQKGVRDEILDRYANAQTSTNQDHRDEMMGEIAHTIADLRSPPHVSRENGSEGPITRVSDYQAQDHDKHRSWEHLEKADVKDLDKALARAVKAKDAKAATIIKAALQARQDTVALIRMANRGASPQEIAKWLVEGQKAPLRMSDKGVKVGGSDARYRHQAKDREMGGVISSP